MKILLVIHEKFNPNSGSAGSTFKLGLEYQKLGHEVWFYSMDDLPRRLPTLVKRFVFPEFVAARIAKLCVQQELDVVDASPGDAWLWGKLFKDLRDKFPVLVTRSHGLQHLKHLADLEDARQGNLRISWKYPLYRGSLQLWEIAASLRNADLVYLLNEQEAKYVIEQLNVKSECVHVFPNGIPDAFLNLPLDSSPKDEGSITRIASIGTYIPRKGIQYSAPALNKVLARYPQVQVSFFGTECRECPAVDRIYADFDPAFHDRIQVVPRYNHEDLPTLLKGHQIKLFSPISEGFGKALIEAMACGLAPITTATAGPLEIVQDGHDAIVVPIRDSQAIELALEKLVTDYSYLEHLRHNAYATAQSYSWGRIAQDRLSVYQKVLQKRGYFEET